LILYDKLVSDRESMEKEKEDLIDIKKHGIRKTDFLEMQIEESMDIDEMVEDIDELEEDPDMGYGIGSLKSNFHDGQFYSDDESDDDFGDDA